MKKTAFLFAALATVAGVQAQDSKSSYSITSDFAYTSKYVFRGIQHSSDAFQPSLEISSNDAYIGIWTNQPIKRHQNNEVDVYGGYKYKFNEQLTFEGVATYYWYPEAHSGLGQTKNTYEAGIGATYSLYGISTTLYDYYDFRMSANTLQGSVGYSIPLKQFGASLDMSGFIGALDARDAVPDLAVPSVHESWVYYGFDLSLPYKLGERATITPAVHWADNRNTPLTWGTNPYVTTGNKFWFSLSMAIGF